MKTADQVTSIFPNYPLLASTKGQRFLDQLSDYKFLKKDSAPQSE